MQWDLLLWAGGLGEGRVSRQGQGRLSHVISSAVFTVIHKAGKAGKAGIIPTVPSARGDLNKIFHVPIQGFFYHITLIHMFIHKRQVKHQNISAITIYETKTFSFLQHEGPGPGHYDLKIPSASSVTSCFQSRVPRFLPACSVSVLKDRHSCRFCGWCRGVEWALGMGWGQ